MKKYEDQLANKSGVFPDCLAINSTGAATPDGSEYIAEIINNADYGVMQALMAYADGGTNTSLSGTPGVPDGVIEAAGGSQILEAIQKAHGIGPGMYVQRAIEDTPAVWGDRVIQLSGQGVLIATYPDLDNATWIGGDTSAQVAAEAAGKKFYRSSDAAGVTGDAAGPYLQLPENPTPQYLKQYIEGTDWTLSVSGATLSSVARGVLIPYQTIDGAWRLKANIQITLTIADGLFAIILPGVVFKTGAIQPFTVSVGGTSSVLRADVTGGDGEIDMRSASTSTNWYISGDVELDSEPTLTDDFSYDWYITY